MSYYTYRQSHERHGWNLDQRCTTCHYQLVIDAIRGEAICTNHGCTKYVPLTLKPITTEDARV